MPLVNRDPFARQELTRARVYEPGVTCAWCGGINKTPKGRKFLFRYTVETDGGTRRQLNNLFCSNPCQAYYNA
jgi:hypothetical protein